MGTGSGVRRLSLSVLRPMLNRCDRLRNFVGSAIGFSKPVLRPGSINRLGVDGIVMGKRFSPISMSGNSFGVGFGNCSKRLISGVAAPSNSLRVGNSTS